MIEVLLVHDSSEALFCVLKQDTLYNPLSTGSTKEDSKMSRHD